MVSAACRKSGSKRSVSTIRVGEQGGGGTVAALPVHALDRGQEADPLVVSESGGPNAQTAGDLSDGHARIMRLAPSCLNERPPALR